MVSLLRSTMERFVRRAAWFPFALVAVSIVQAAPAQADWSLSRSCVGSWGMHNCVFNWRDYPRDPHLRYAAGPVGEGERGEALARDRKWLAYCKPVLVKDRYGVSRYRYARPGCEFGRSED
ncbi:MAG: hypothetical protein KJZ73_08720 [Pseudorhodoplanes sp.]|nr:hypothetical protein [Pseudorhodoplanes sp.]MBW7948429.1 hypothetical protein [Pseudorhodoplanes sp.]MCL4711317.1 hypothetical protein [Pseudorhodoplanes sp.]MCQ3943148.1 hypothetical protein [Alphaproteobacteria bacterium]GIK81954.1 MAG: hypothetical protein BroJett024_30590 [Alphaproteobacteria bacterium]